MMGVATRSWAGPQDTGIGMCGRGYYEVGVVFMRVGGLFEGVVI